MRIHVPYGRHFPPNNIWKICQIELVTIQLDSCLKPSAAPCHTGTNISDNPAIDSPIDSLFI